nr:MAG TPA: hypothetical protein [Caudoviricetes sp.]
MPKAQSIALYQGCSRNTTQTVLNTEKKWIPLQSSRAWC